MNYAVSGTNQAQLRNRSTLQRGARSSGSSGFLTMLSQTAKARGDSIDISSIGRTASAFALSSSVDLSVMSASGRIDIQAAATESVSLESMLKARYPGLAYHVFDASTSDWRTRNDYPHYLLYQDNDDATEKLKNWQSKGPNPPYGSVDGRFTAPKEIYALGSLPPGSKAVAIHPKAQERMEEDPEFAKEVLDRINAWFAFDVARNEAILPGCTWDMAQSVAIGEDGSIVNVQSSSPGGRITHSGDDEAERLYRKRLKRSKELMDLRVAAQIQRAMAYSKYLSAASLAHSKQRAAFAKGLSCEGLQKLLGETVAGVSAADLLALLGGELGMGL